MRKKYSNLSNNFKILLLDDEQGILDSLSVVLRRNGYYTEGVTSPLQAISKLQDEHFDMLILDFLMEPIHGDKVVEKVREFDKDIHIILLTGHKDLAPPIETINTLQIQGYCEKGDNFDQLLLMVEAGKKALISIKTITEYKNGLNNIINSFSKVYEAQTIETVLEQILQSVKEFSKADDSLVFIYNPLTQKNIARGIGTYSDGIKSLNKELLDVITKSQNEQRRIELEKGFNLPLVYNSQTLGSMYIECDKTESNLKLLEIFTSQISSYINYVIIQTILKNRNVELVEHQQSGQNDYKKIIDTFMLLVEYRDSDLRGHLERVSYYSVKLGEQFDLSKSELEDLRVSGLMHDIFQTDGIDDIYSKSNYAHIIKAIETFSEINMFKHIVDIINYHHEKVDGSGFHQLDNNKIPFLSRILSVADSFDVLMNTTQNGATLGMEEVKERLIQSKGIQFDGEIVDQFINLLEDYYLMEEELGHTYKSN